MVSQNNPRSMPLIPSDNMTFGGDKPTRCGRNHASAAQPDITPASVGNSKLAPVVPAPRTCINDNDTQTSNANVARLFEVFLMAAISLGCIPLFALFSVKVN